jgi:large subunit ribosomal protein L17
MWKRKNGRKFSRKTGPRKALIRSLITSLFIQEKIKTTEAKAKGISSFTERFITKAKRGDIPARRFLARFFSQKITKKLIEEIAPRYKDRKGGYTRIVKLGPRKNDGAKMAIIELVK